MALKKCRECGRAVSSKAKSCPHCGAPLKGGGIIRGILKLFTAFFLLIGIILIIGVVVNQTESTSQQVASKPKTEARLDTSPETQEKRKELIEQLIGQGVFYKVEQPAALPHAYTGPQWSALNVDEKRSFSNLVLTFYYANNSQADILVLKDGKTGKDVGTFTFSTGLDLD